MNELKTVRLYGVLGVQFGRKHQLAIDSPKEAIKALSVLHDGFEQFLAEAHLKGMEFAVFKGTQNIGEDELHINTGEEIRIAPIIKGSKRGGFFQTILGVAMIGSAMMLGPAGWAALGAGGVWGERWHWVGRLWLLVAWFKCCRHNRVVYPCVRMPTINPLMLSAVRSIPQRKVIRCRFSIR
ncbi:Bacteriophage lambda tail assembly protein I [Xenorhabdus koppenhoeferi]|uniref:Bacteriophage lambda tail assembly protein I n=1 Tax=Xenorhabdus koppenhoeferi TaxID=351659 RepID=A0A1I7G6K6_9GAMM|nr:Bacteriophage lambda tail assembly protein I [Xenorhabdus koppenhoeferi]